MPDIHRTGISGRRKYHAAGHIIKHNIKAMSLYVGSLPTFSKPEPFAVNGDCRLLRKLRYCGNTGYIGSMELIGGKPATRPGRRDRNASWRRLPTARLQTHARPVVCDGNSSDRTSYKETVQKEQPNKIPGS